VIKVNGKGHSAPSCATGRQSGNTGIEDVELAIKGKANVTTQEAIWPHEYTRVETNGPNGDMSTQANTESVLTCGPPNATLPNRKQD
jgi:hypothetical protein